MPINGGKAYHAGVFRLLSPNEPQRKIIKRNRQVVSCIPCRTRKLKCDRQQPCASCVKRHDDASCRFFAGPGQDGASPGPGPPVQKNEMRAKLRMLEDMVSGMMGQSEPHGAGAAERTRASTESLAGGNPAGPSQPRPQLPTENADLRTEDEDGGEARPAGGRNYSAVLDSIRDLQGFVDADFAKPTSARTASEQRSESFPRAQHEAEPRGVLEEALGCLPPRSECDNILSLYFQQRYMVPMVLHAGQFQRIYEQFWRDPSSVSPLWLSMLFSLLSTSFFQQLSKTSPSATGNTTVAAEIKSRVAGYSSMAYHCLTVGNHLEGGPFSVEATLVFGMHLVLQKRDSDPRCWHMIGTAVTLAQRSGYHRDATRSDRGGTSNGISPFEAEMRRRTWHTLEYFDVLFSFQLGIPPIINNDFVDVPVPSNLSDEDFDESSSVLPLPRLKTELAPILVYVFLSKQVLLLHRVVQQALALKQPSYMEVMSLDGDLVALHNEVPPGLRWRPIRESGLTDIPDVIMRRITCETTYLKSLCVLHRRYLTFGRQNDAYAHSRKACVDASLRLLQVQAEFDENSGEGGRLYERRYLLTNLAYHDFLLAAMCICIDLIVGAREGQVHDHERRVQALEQARAIWHKVADWSPEATHATRMLDQILTRVPAPGQRIRDSVGADDPPREPSASTAQAHTTATDGGAAGESTSRVDTSKLPRGGANDRSLPTPTQSNRQASSVSKALHPQTNREEGWSQEWELGRLDDIRERVSRGSGGLSEETTYALGVDWGQIDSFIFARRPGPGSLVGGPLAAANDDSQMGESLGDPSDSRDKWPYPTWNDRVDDRHGGGGTPHARTWPSAKITLAGFCPSSSISSGFL